VLASEEAGERCSAGPMPARSVSWIPGAEGAPVDLGERWLWLLEWAAGGAIRMAYIEGSVSLWGTLRGGRWVF
jgi:hypothetical protein